MPGPRACGGRGLSRFPNPLPPPFGRGGCQSVATVAAFVGSSPHRRVFLQEVVLVQPHGRVGYGVLGQQLVYALEAAFPWWFRPHQRVVVRHLPGGLATDHRGVALGFRPLSVRRKSWSLA